MKEKEKLLKNDPPPPIQFIICQDYLINLQRFDALPLFDASFAKRF